MKTTMKRLTALLVALLLCVGVVSAATTLPSGWSTTRKPSGSVVSVYGSTTTYGGESQAIKSGPLYKSSGRVPIRRILPITRVSGFLR